MIKQKMEHLSQYVEKTEDIDVMSILNAAPENPLWKNINFSYDLAKKYYDNENIYAYLLRKTNKEEIIIDYLIKESPQHLLDVKLGKKDIIGHYFKEFENSNSNQKNNTIISTFNSILENKNTFDIILKNNKTKLKILTTINDENLNKKLNYQLMSSKFENEEKKENKTKMKI